MSDILTVICALDVIMDAHSMQGSWKSEKLLVLFDYEEFTSTPLDSKFFLTSQTHLKSDIYVLIFYSKFFQLLIVSKIFHHMASKLF